MAYDFPNSPTVGQIYNGYIWDGEKWLTSGAPGPVVAYRKNYVVNGAMMISQENGSTPVSVSSSYPVDCFGIGVVTSGGGWNAAQIASTSPAGSPNRIRFTVTTADTTIVAGDIAYFFTNIEGYRVADLLFGTAAAKTITVQFGVRAPAGTWSIIIMNYAANRVYVKDYVIAAGEANTDVIRAVTIPGDVTGTWDKTSNKGLDVRWGMMCGTTYQAPLGWSVPSIGSIGGSPSISNIFATNGNIFELFDVSVTEGTVAPPFTVPDIAPEKLLCRRYFQYQTGTSGMWIHPLDNTNLYRRRWYEFQPEMRAAPAVTFTYTVGGAGTATPAANQITALNCELAGDTTAAAGYVYFTTLKANARP